MLRIFAGCGIICVCGGRKHSSTRMWYPYREALSQLLKWFMDLAPLAGATIMFC